jgi:hypothetical protein
MSSNSDDDHHSAAVHALSCYTAAIDVAVSVQ